MKTIQILIFLIFGFTNVYSQQAKSNFMFQWSDEFSLNKRGVMHTVISADEKNLNLLFEHRNNFFSINQLDNKLKLKQNKPFQLEFFGKEHYYMDIIEVDNIKYVFTQLVDNNKKINSTWVHQYNETTQKLESSKQLFSLDFTGFRRNEKGEILIEISPNQEKVAVIYDLPSNSESVKKIGYIIFDNQLNELWRNEIELPFERGNFNIYSTLLKDDGELILFGQKILERNKRRSPLRVQYMLFHFKQNGESVTKNIEIENHRVVEFRAELLENNNIAIAGFYSGLKIAESIKGAFYMVYDINDNNFIVNEKKDFELRFIVENLNPRQVRRVNKRAARGQEPEMPNYHMHYLITKQNGGAILIAEQYFVTVVQNYNPNTRTYSYTYYFNYNDIIVVSFTELGVVEWSSKIPKQQMTANDFGANSSFSLVIRENKLHFVYYDNIDNITSKTSNPVNAFARRGKLVLSAATLNYDGSFKREKLFSLRDEPLLFFPNRSQQISENELLIHLGRKNKNKFGIIQFLN